MRNPKARELLNWNRRVVYELGRKSGELSKRLSSTLLLYIFRNLDVIFRNGSRFFLHVEAKMLPAKPNQHFSFYFSIEITGTMTTVVTKIEKEEEAARPESKDMCEEGAEEENSTTALGEY